MDTRSTQDSASRLNDLAEQTLSGLAEIGQGYGDLKARFPKVSERIDEVLSVGALVAQQSVPKDAFGGRPRSSGPGGLGALLNGVFGTLDVLSAVAADRRAGDQTYGRSLFAIVKSVGQITASGSLGIAVTGGLSAMVGAGLFPFVAGAATAVAAGYLVGQGAEFARKRGGWFET